MFDDRLPQFLIYDVIIGAKVYCVSEKQKWKKGEKNHISWINHLFGRSQLLNKSLSNLAHNEDMTT